MLDTYQPEPFDGAERLRKFCQTVDETPAEIPKPRYDVEHTTLVPRTGLFDIVRRQTNKIVYDKNDIVAMGFTYEQAVEFRKTRLKTKIDEENTVATFYEIVAQGDEEALNPLWNPKVFVKEN